MVEHHVDTLSDAVRRGQVLRADFERTVTASPMNNYPLWKVQLAAAVEALSDGLTKAGADLRQGPSTAVVDWAGIRTSSTTGLVGAFSAWLVKASKAQGENS